METCEIPASALGLIAELLNKPDAANCRKLKDMLIEADLLAWCPNYCIVYPPCEAAY